MKHETEIPIVLLNAGDNNLERVDMNDFSEEPGGVDALIDRMVGMQHRHVL